MADFGAIVGAIKTAAVGAVDANNPVDLQFGTVVSANPLKIDVEQKKTLAVMQLVLSRNVTDYYVDMTVQHQTELETEHTHAVIDTYSGGGSSEPTQHLHEYTGTKRYLVHNALQAGEKVVLIRLAGGQKYLVLDRLEGSPDVTNGEYIA
jgi:hypothetical protein